MIEYDNIIKNKDDLLYQLNSLKQDALENFREMPNDLKATFQRDLHALRIVIRLIKDVEK